MRKLALAVAAAAVLGLFAGGAWAGNLPSSKAAASIGELTALGIACKDAGNFDDGDLTDGTPCDEGAVAETPWTTVQQTFIKTPNGKELAFDVAIQCGLVTFTQVKSKGGAKDSSAAEAEIKIRVRIDDVANNTLEVIPGTTRFAEPGEDSTASNGVTYCQRLQKLDAVFQGILQTGDEFQIEDPDNVVGDDEGLIGDGNCDPGEDCITVVGTCLLVDPNTGNTVLDVDCLEPEELALLLETLTANAFNFLSANETPGIKRIQVQAKAKADANIFGGEGSAKGEAFVGLGSMLVETVRMVKDADGTPVIQDLD